MKKTALSFVLLFISVTTEAQTKFTQFYSSPLLINPASTGRFNKSYRLGVAFRRELNTQNYIFTQAHFFADFKIFKSKLAENESMAIGLSGLNEQSTTEGINNNYFSAAIAYQKKLDEEGTQQLGIGFQATLARNRLERPTYVLEDQLVSWSHSGYVNMNPSLLQNVNVNYAEFNAGLFYQGKINLKNYFTIGLSVQHINKPNKKFQGGELQIQPDYWANIGWESVLENNNRLYSAVISKFTQRNLQDLTGGLTYEKGLRKFTHLAIGAWIRKNNFKGISVAPLLGINHNDLKISLSYDINISRTNSSQRSASELSLIYTKAQSRKSFLENRFIKF